MKSPVLKKNLLALLLILLGVLTVMAAPLRLAWDASPDAKVTGYFLYASTNVLSDATITTNTFKLDTGTNRLVTMTNLAPGIYWFGATAHDTNGIESVLSNVIIADVPVAPANVRTVIVQATATLNSTNWQDIMFLRLKLP